MSFLSGLFGSNKSNSAQPTAASGLSVQTSVQGQPITLTYGTTRVAGNMIWYGNFTATQQQSSGGAGKGGLTGGGGKGGGSAGYTYSTSFELALGEGPANNIWNVYYDKTVTTLSGANLGWFDGQYGQAPWSYLIQQGQEVTETHTVPSSGPYTVTVNQTSIEDGGVTAALPTTFTATSGAPALNEYVLSLQPEGTAYYVFNAANAGDNVAISYTTITDGRQVFNGTVPLSVDSQGNYAISVRAEVVNYQDNGVTSASQVLVAVPGSPASGQYNVSGDVYTFNSAQAGDSVDITYLPVLANTQALGYSGITYVVAANYALGNNPQLPNFNFELQGLLSNTFQQEAIGEQYVVPGAPYQVEVRFNTSLFVSDGGVVDQDGNVYTVGSGANQYTVSGSGVYTFNAANSGAIVNVTYTASVGPDADPSAVAVDLLTNAH